MTFVHTTIVRVTNETRMDKSFSPEIQVKLYSESKQQKNLNKKDVGFQPKSGAFITLVQKEFEVEKMPQSGVGSMQGKNTGNIPSAVCASSMNKSLDPSPI